MRMETKDFDVEVDQGDDEGVFTGYAATWDRDLVDDVVLKGAFAKTLADDYGGTGAGIPIYWNHSYRSPMNLIGQSISAAEDDHGLLFKGRIDTATNEGKQVYKLMKSGLVHQMSIGFIVEDSRIAELDDARSPFDVYREIKELKLMEVSIVTIAANQGAEINEVKSGRVLSRANEEKVRAAYEALGEVLDQLLSDDGGETGQDVTDEGAGPDEDPDPDRKSIDRDERAVEFKKFAEFFGGESD